MLGISIDSEYALKEYADQLGVKYPLLSDFRWNVSRSYGIFRDDVGLARRTTYVVDKNGIVRHIEQGREAIDTSGTQDVCKRLS